VGRHDPLQVFGREAELPADRRQRHVHDPDVEDDHELHDHQQAEDLPRRALLRIPGDWVDARIDDWARANGVAGPDPLGREPGSAGSTTSAA
jgi:hypothetical protein